MQLAEWDMLQGQPMRSILGRLMAHVQDLSCWLATWNGRSCMYNSRRVSLWPHANVHSSAGLPTGRAMVHAVLCMK